MNSKKRIIFASGTIALAVAAGSYWILWPGTGGLSAANAFDSKSTRVRKPTQDTRRSIGPSLTEDPPARAIAYDCDFRSGIERQDAGNLSFQLSGSATLSLTRIDAPKPMTRLRGQLSSLSVFVEGGGQEAQQVQDKFASDFRSPFVITQDRSGRVTALEVSAKTIGAGQGALRMIVAALQFVRPGPEQGVGGSWFTVESDHLGTYRAQYTAEPDGTYRKRKLEYSTLTLAEQFKLREQGLKAEVEASAVYHLDHAGTVLALTAEESVNVPLGASGFRSRSRVTLAPAQAKDLETSAALPDDLVVVPLMGVISTPSTGPTLEQKRRLVGNASFQDVLTELGASQNSDQRWTAIERFTALFDTNPTSIAQAKQLLAAEGNTKRSEFLLAALADATSPEAQAALIDVARAGEYAPELRRAAISQIALDDNPGDQVLPALREMAADPSNPGSREAVLAMGSAARRQSPETAEQVGAELSRDLGAANSSMDRTLLLAALGNSGSASALASAKQALSDADPTVRAAAVLALRLVSGVEAEALIIRTLQGDDSSEVRLAAVNALMQRDLSVEVESAVTRALTADTSEIVRLRLVSLASRHVASSPGLKRALTDASAKDPSEEVREAAARAVSSA